MTGFTIDDDAIRKLASLLDETDLTEIEVADGERKLRVARQPAGIGAGVPVMATPAAQTPVAPPSPAVVPPVSGGGDDFTGHPGAVKSPMVGVVYLAPEPGAGAFISLGATVSEGQTIMLIEAMKTFNPVRAPKAGKIARILVADGMPVEYDEPLVVIE